MTKQDYRATLIQIRELSREWQECSCRGNCPSCIERICRIEELADDLLKF